jgi:hypothetical protein
MTNTKHFLRLFGLLIATIVATVVVHDLLPRENQNLENVLKRVASLNEQLDFGTEFITSDTKGSAKEISADVFGELGKPTYKGFIATLDDSVGSDDILIPEPHTPLSDEETEVLADKYVDAIPEFNTVELDQDIELEGEPSEQTTLSVPATQAAVPAKTVRVAVLDSGIDRDHTVFANKPLLSGWNTVEESSDVYGNKLPKSNFGDRVDVAAYGNNIFSAAPGQKYQRMSGTSQATAVVTANFVDYLQKSSLKGMSFISSL